MDNPFTQPLPYIHESAATIMSYYDCCLFVVVVFVCVTAETCSVEDYILEL